MAAWCGVLALLVVAADREIAFGAVLAGALAAAGAGSYFYARLPSLFLGALGGGLIAYAVMGRGFAYFGVPPVYVGELLLLWGVATLVVRGDLRAVARTPIAWLMLAFIVIGAGATIPYLGVHGINAIRDAAQWGYAVFALVVTGLVTSAAGVARVVVWYRRSLPWLVAGPLGAFVVLAVAGSSLPFAPFSGVPILVFKGGDVAVHLAGVLAFLLLGLHRAFGDGRQRATGAREWWWWSLWLMAWVTTLTVRASFVTMAVAGAVVMVLRPTGRWWRLVVIIAVLMAASVAFDLELTVGREGRPVSAEGVFVIIRSIYEPVGSGILDGSRGWRLRWWSDIVGYTLLGDYFWTGKGFGINLADADGYQVSSDRSLRSPHNGHLTILARAGVPGAVSWMALNLALFGGLVLAYQRRRAEGRMNWAHLNLWLAVYLLAFLTNASFDVYLEGPMGGIWFWAVVGLALSVLRVQGATDDDLGPNGGAPHPAWRSAVTTRSLAEEMASVARRR